MALHNPYSHIPIKAAWRAVDDGSCAKETSGCVWGCLCGTVEIV